MYLSCGAAALLCFLSWPVPLAALPPSALECAGDCNGNGTIGIDELVVQVAISLQAQPLARCLAADTNGDTLVSIDELVRGVSGALYGCVPAATPTETQPPTSTPTGEPPTVTPSPLEPTASPTATETGVPEFTATASRTISGAPSATRTPSRTATQSPAFTATPSLAPTRSPTGTATASRTASPPASATRTPTRTPSGPAGTATITRTVTVTRTRTLTATPTKTVVPGVRRFSLAPATSLIRTVPGDLTTTGFQGYLDLALGPEDSETGLRSVDLVGASEFLSINLGLANLCLRPMVPQVRAGVIACGGGVDLGLTTTQDHNIGVVGVSGFTADDCIRPGGTIEQSPGDPHPGVCNGPTFTLPGGVDSGAGALLIAPDPRYDTVGIPVELTILPGPCATHGPGEAQLFGFVSGLHRVRIFDADNIAGNTFEHVAQGENFSCETFTQENGPGRLVLNIRVLHGGDGGATDIVTVFELDD